MTIIYIILPIQTEILPFQSFGIINIYMCVILKHQNVMLHVNAHEIEVINKFYRKAVCGSNEYHYLKRRK